MALPVRNRVGTGLNAREAACMAYYQQHPDMLRALLGRDPAGEPVLAHDLAALMAAWRRDVPRESIVHQTAPICQS